MSAALIAAGVKLTASANVGTCRRLFKLLSMSSESLSAAYACPGSKETYYRCKRALIPSSRRPTDTGIPP